MSRKCDSCGSQMSPRWPRKRVNNEMWCPSCVDKNSHVQKTSVRDRLLRMARTGWSGEDIIRHELGRQPVQTLSDGQQVCPEHLRARRSSPGFVASVSPVHEGRCGDCKEMYGAGSMNLPWGGDMMSMRVAVAVKNSRAWPGIRMQAHDSGDGETIFHCPFCGSGQVIARSDGTVECEFCSTAFTVQVQPMMPAFPQTIDGVPVDVPGMPNGGQSANIPAEPGVPGSFPGGEDVSDDPSAEGVDAEGPPEFLKNSLLLRTASGGVLNEDQFMRYLALAHANDREAIISKVREENGVS